jgi:hypothetical protein
MEKIYQQARKSKKDSISKQHILWNSVFSLAADNLVELLVVCVQHQRLL